MLKGKSMTSAVRGWATLAWQSDYGQFYVLDCEDDVFQPPVEMTAEMTAHSLFVPPAGLVVYTGDCLQQHLRVRIYDAEPDHAPHEEMSGKAWTRAETTEVRFPSRSFRLSSPSMPDPLPCGPIFLVDVPDMAARVCWMEFEGSRDDSVPVEPDVIEITLWPLRARDE